MVIIMSHNQEFAESLAAKLRPEITEPVRTLMDYEGFLLFTGMLNFQVLVVDYQEPRENFLRFIRVVKKMHPHAFTVGLFPNILLRDEALDAQLDRSQAHGLLPGLIKLNLSGN